MDTEKNRHAQYNVRAKNIIAFALTLDEFYCNSQCADANEICEILEVTHKDIMEVKKERKNALIQEYKMFKILSGKSISDVQKHLIHW